MPHFNLAAGIIITTVLFSTTIVFGQDNEIITELTKGKELLRLEQYEKALPYFDTVLEKDPTNLDALMAKSILHILNKEFEEASSTLDKILVLNPNDIEALNLKMIATGSLGKTLEAGTYLVRISELNQKVQVLTLQGFQHYIKDEFNDALSYFDEALEINPKHAQAVAGKALALFDLDKFEDAMIAMNEAALLAPNDPNIQRDQLQMLLLLPRYASHDGSLKLQIRDSNGGLVGYQEVFDIEILRYNSTENFLDTFNVKGSISKEGKNYEILQIKIKAVLEFDKPFSQTWIGTFDAEKSLDHMFALHHGTPTEKGDQISELWTVIRPIG